MFQVSELFLVAMHVHLVAMHVHLVAMHVHLVAMHVHLVAMHVHLVAMHVQYVLPKVPELGPFATQMPSIILLCTCCVFLFYNFVPTEASESLLFLVIH